MSLPVDPSVPNLNDCGCCDGVTTQTPAVIANRPGLPALSCRVGTHAQFTQTMLARLSARERPALAGLQTREKDDFSIALVDAWAMVADVLTFYQERIANESYLRTATERRSILDLARLIGYELRPGVAAGTYLAFTLDEAPDAPRKVTIPIGVKVQSIPGPDEKPETFETVEKIEARAMWNALKPRLTGPQVLHAGDTSVYLNGTSTNLKPGDRLLFVGKEKEDNPRSDRWNVRRLQTVEMDQAGGRTLVTWEHELDGKLPADSRIFVFRQRASLFGSTAQDWRPLPNSMKANYLGLANPEDLVEEETHEWPSFKIYSPEYPLRQEPPVVIPTAKAVAAAAIKAAHAAADKARTDALTSAIGAAKEALKILKDAKDTLEPKIGGVIGKGLGPITTVLTDLRTALDQLSKIEGTINAAFTGMTGEIQIILNEIKGMLPNLKGKEGERGRGPTQNEVVDGIKHIFGI